MSFLAVSNKTARRAAVVAAVIFIAFAGLQVYWAFGGSWGMAGVWGGQQAELSRQLMAASGVSAVILLVGALVVLGRAGVWTLGLLYGVFRWGIWVYFVIIAVSTVLNYSSESVWERSLNAPVATVLTIMCLIVARSAVRPR